MSSLNSIFKHRLVRVALLLVMATARLPVTVASAESQSFTVPKAVVDASVWKAVWRQTYSRATGVEQLLYAEFLVQLYKNNPALDPQEAVSVIHELSQRYEATVADGQDAGYRSLKGYDEIVRAMFDVALDMPKLAPTIKNAWEIMVNQALSPQLDSATSIAALARRYELPDSLREREDAVLQSVIEMARQFPNFVAAYDQLTGATLNASVGDIDATKLMVAHPTLYVPPRIRDHILPNGTVDISLLELKDLTQIEVDKFNAILTDLRGTIKTIDASQEKILDYIKDQKKREEMQALAKAKAEEDKLNLDARKSAFSIISTLIGLSDAKLGKQVGTILTSYGQIGDALGDWLEAVAKLDGLDKLTSMSTMVMTGNVLGAVMNIVNLFSSSGPTTDELILQSIAKLRQQIDDLRKDMDRRFDRIDQELNTIYTTMQDRFNLIDLQLGKLNGNVQEIQRTLIGIDLALSRIERNNYEFLDAAHRRPLLNAINGAIDYQARTGLAMPYQPDFVDNENVFQSWGTIHAFDALSAGPVQRNFSDAQVLAELNALPLDSNINYLNGWLLAHGLTPFANSRLASSRDWTFASRAYSQMALDWPEHINRINPERRAALDQVGANLDAAVRHISTLDTPSGPQGNKPLYAGVVDYYRAKLAQLDAGIQPLETAFIQEVQALRLERAEPFDLWGGMDQPVTYESPEFASMTCGVPEGLGYIGISSLKTMVPNFNRYMLAEYLKQGKFKVCLSGAWVDQTPQCNPKLGCKIIARYQVTVDVKFEDVSVESRSYTIDFWEEMHGNPQTQLVSRWGTSLRNTFETDATRNAPSDELQAQREALLAKTTSDLQDKLGGYQQELYARVFNELTAGSLKPRATELSGGKALLDSFITLGLPRAVTNDDLMRALLFGNQRVFDDQLVADTYALSVVQPITQVQIMSDTRVVLNQVATERIDALDMLVTAYLDAIGDSAHVEEFNLVANARLELRLAGKLAKLQQQQQLFMPLLQR